MQFEFDAEVWYWKGPAPFYFVTVPPGACAALQEVSGLVTYGWGMIPATIRLGGTEWKTSLFPKDGGYVVPLRDAVWDAERVGEGDRVSLRLRVDVRDA